MNYLYQYEQNTLNLIKKGYALNPQKYPDITTYLNTFNQYGIGSKEYKLNKAIELAKDIEVKGRARLYDELNVKPSVASALLNR